jgi:hypothetical protein
MKAGAKWNTLEITAQKSHFVVILNGTKTIDAESTTHAKGPIGLVPVGQVPQRPNQAALGDRYAHDRVGIYKTYHVAELRAGFQMQLCVENVRKTVE